MKRVERDCLPCHVKPSASSPIKGISPRPNFTTPRIAEQPSRPQLPAAHKSKNKTPTRIAKWISLLPLPPTSSEISPALFSHYLSISTISPSEFSQPFSRHSIPLLTLLPILAVTSSWRTRTFPSLRAASGSRPIPPSSGAPPS